MAETLEALICGILFNYVSTYLPFDATENARILTQLLGREWWAIT